MAAVSGTRAAQGRGANRRPARRPPRPRRHLRLLVRLIAVLAVLVAAGSVAVAWVLAPPTSDLPARAAREAVADGGRPVALSSVALVMRQAVVDTEDERFYRHHGVDVVGVIRAAGYDASHLSLQQGASTITEQLVKLLYLQGDDRSAWRKLDDAVIAFRLESSASKAQILQSYLNVAYFGSGAYGVADAADRYFGVAPSRLSLGEASLLAGLIQAPSTYDPYANPAAARHRQAQVLASMVRNHDITVREGDRVLSQPLPLALGPALPPLAGVTLAPPPAFSTVLLAAGLALVVAAAGLLLARRRRAVPFLVGLLWLPSLAAGLVLTARAFRVE